MENERSILLFLPIIKYFWLLVFTLRSMAWVKIWLRICGFEREDYFTSGLPYASHFPISPVCFNLKSTNKRSIVPNYSKMTSIEYRHFLNDSSYLKFWYILDRDIRRETLSKAWLRWRICLYYISLNNCCEIYSHFSPFCQRNLLYICYISLWGVCF